MKMEDKKYSKNELRNQLKSTQKEFEEIGGWQVFKNGEWVLPFIEKVFQSYYSNANAEHLMEKYKSKDNSYIAKKLISNSAKNAALLGGIVGATISADEIVAIITGGEVGVGLPANIALALTAIAGESLLLLKLQLQLVANLAKIYEVRFDINDPEDVMVILGFLLGGTAVDIGGKSAVKMGGNITQYFIKTHVKKDILKFLKKVGKALGVKLVQKTLIKYTVPLVSIGIGSGWNYISTNVVGKVAQEYLKKRLENTTETAKKYRSESEIIFNV